MKIIYLEQKEVKIGDKVFLNGVDVTVTQQLIDDLPNLFKVEEEDDETFPEYVECTLPITEVKRGEIVKSWYDHTHSWSYRFETSMGINGFGRESSFYEHFKPSTKEAWLLQEAKRRYPKGTKFRSVGALKEINESFGVGTMHPTYEVIGNKGGKGCFYKEGQWAEIVKPLFTTEDGVEIFEGDESCGVRKFDLYIMGVGEYLGNNSQEILYFSTREAAEEYIAKHKEKTLEDYENELLKYVYQWLKDNEPKLYWIKVLQLIADDLNGDKTINFHHRDRECLYNLSSRGVNSHCGPSEGCVYFYDRKKAEKAIEIMGDKLDLIYKN